VPTIGVVDPIWPIRRLCPILPWGQDKRKRPKVRIDRVVIDRRVPSTIQMDSISHDQTWPSVDLKVRHPVGVEGASIRRVGPIDLLLHRLGGPPRALAATLESKVKKNSSLGRDAREAPRVL
jgi:hypothetical protein